MNSNNYFMNKRYWILLIINTTWGLNYYCTTFPQPHYDHVIHRDFSKNEVDKLCYAVRGPYQIICKTKHNSYFVRKLNKLDSSKLSSWITIYFPFSHHLNLVNVICNRYRLFESISRFTCQPFKIQREIV